MAPTSDEKLDALLNAVGQLTTVVGALAQTVAQSTADSAAGVPAPSDEVTFVVTQDDAYLPLVPRTDDNLLQRTKLAAELGVLGTPAGAELVEHGARGFYRSLDRDEGSERIELPRDLARRLVEDALAEDPREAAHMGRDLLCVWDQDEAETFAARGGVDILADTK